MKGTLAEILHVNRDQPIVESEGRLRGWLPRGDCLAIYKLYVEMADRISARRQTANSFFLTINTGVTALTASFAGQPLGRAWMPSFAGIVLCVAWSRLIRSYREINSGKFRVIHEIERLLPLSPYSAEWEALGRGKNANLYKPFTRVEVVVPWVFGALHAFAAIWILAMKVAPA